MNKDENSINNLRKLVEANPNDRTSKWLLESWERLSSTAPIERSKSTEIEDEDPVIMGRGGECDIALEVLIEFYPDGKPYRFTSNGSDFTHVFLMCEGTPMDILGITTFEEIKDFYQNDALKPEPVTMEQIQKYFGDHKMDQHDDRWRYKQLFRKHILANIGSSFPPIRKNTKL